MWTLNFFHNLFLYHEHFFGLAIELAEQHLSVQKYSIHARMASERVMTVEVCLGAVKNHSPARPAHRPEPKFSDGPWTTGLGK